MSIIPRLNRLLASDGHCFDVAIDHGFFNERAFLDNIENIRRLKPQCNRYGMPLMIEPLVMQTNSKGGGYMVDGDLNKILPLVRQAVELGAEIIKADPCDDVSKYHKVIEIASGRPVLVRGGGKTSDEEIVTRTYQLMRQGAAGTVYGRKVIQERSSIISGGSVYIS